LRTLDNDKGPGKYRDLIGKGVHHPLNEHQKGDGDKRGHDLDQVLGTGPQLKPVVNKAGHEQKGAPQHDAQEAGQLLGVLTGHWQPLGHQCRCYKGEEEGNAACAGDCALVPAARAGPVD